jgi:hypothetical protein
MPSELQESRRNFYWRDLVVYLIPVLGAIVSFGLASYFTRIGQKHSLRYDIARDIGMALLVALVVALVYEVYSKRLYEGRRFISTLQVIMDEIVHPRVWEEVRNQIIERTMIRENNQIRLTLEEQSGLTNGQMVLCVDYEYDVRSLRSKPVPFTILHYLDDHIQCAENDLPRFEQVEVGSKNYSGDKLKEKTVGGVFSLALTLKPRDKDPVRVRTRRKEITYVPGSYNLIMGEICDGVRINLDKIPPGIVAHVHVWPHTKNPIPLKLGPTVDRFHDKILLPGQGCEFRFTPEITSAALPLFDMQPRLVQGYWLHIVSPGEGENVRDDGWVTGTANPPTNSFLWVFVGVSTSPDQWWPQGPGVVEINEDSNWEVHVFYGQRGETGRFRLAAIVVDRKTNRQLQKRYAAGVIKGHFDPIALPQPIEDGLIKMLEVEKTSVPLAQVRSLHAAAEIERRSKLERRGRVLAVKKERRASLDRRSRKAG